MSIQTHRALTLPYPKREWRGTRNKTVGILLPKIMRNKLWDFEDLGERHQQFFHVFYFFSIRTFVSKNTFSRHIFFYSSFLFLLNSKQYFFFLNTHIPDFLLVVPRVIKRTILNLRSCLHSFEILPDLFSFFYLIGTLFETFYVSKITSTTLPSISLGSVFGFSPERSRVCFLFLARILPQTFSRSLPFPSHFSFP